MQLANDLKDTKLIFAFVLVVELLIECLLLQHDGEEQNGLMNGCDQSNV